MWCLAIEKLVEETHIGNEDHNKYIQIWDNNFLKGKNMKLVFWEISVNTYFNGIQDLRSGDLKVYYAERKTT